MPKLLHQFYEYLLLLFFNWEVMGAVDGKITRFVFRGNCGYGEPLNLKIVPSDKNGDPLLQPSVIAKKKDFIKHPLEVSDDAVHKISLIADDPAGNHFTFFLSGFRPNEEISFISHSCHEEI